MKRTFALYLVLALLFTMAALPVASAEGEKVDLVIMSSDNGRVNMPDNPIVKEIGDRTNVNIDLQLIAGADFATKLNTMISSGLTPDIVRMGGYDHFNYIDQEVFLPIDDLLNEYAPHIMDYVPEAVWNVTMVNGVKYGVPSYNWPGKYVHVLRKDWMDTLNMAAPTNLEELKAVYEAFTNADPDGNGEKDTYGLCTILELTAGTGTYTTFFPIFGAFGTMPMYYSLDGDTVRYGSITKEFKEAVAYIADLYQSGLVDPDLFIIKSEQAQQNVVAGKSGSYTAWWSYPTIIFFDQLNMKAVSPDVEWAYAHIVGPNGDQGVMASGMASGMACISADCKNPEAAVKLLDFLVSDEGANLAAFGILDEHYTADENGQFLKRTEAGDKAYNDKWLDAMHQIVTRVDLSMRGYELNNPTAWNDVVEARDNVLYYNLFEGYSVPEMALYTADMNNTELSWFTKFVTGEASLDQFDTYVSDWLAKGGKEVAEALVAAYNERNGTNYTFSAEVG